MTTTRPLAAMGLALVACTHVIEPVPAVSSAGQDIASAQVGGGSRVLSGTSMATPYTAGVTALCAQAQPQARPAEIARCVLARATTDILSGIGPGSPNRLLYAGRATSPIALPAKRSHGRRR